MTKRKTSKRSAEFFSETQRPPLADDAAEPAAAEWAREFDVLHARMQTPKAREAVDALFSAKDAKLNGTGAASRDC